MRVLVLASALTVALVGLSACSSSSDGAAEESTTTTESTQTTIAADGGAGAAPGAGTTGGTGQGGGAQGGAVAGGGGQGGGVAPAPQADDQVLVPELYNMSRAAAEQLLRDRGLVPDPVPRDDWATHMLPAGQVTGQTPISGLMVPRGNFVVFYVSEGPQSVLVPNVVGMCEDAARNALRAAGFFMRSFEVASALGYHKVVAQDPQGPPAVMQGTTVSVDVSNNAGQQCF